MASPSLPDSDLLLIIEMCNEGIEKCDSRASDSSQSEKTTAWNRQVRDRYVRLRSELVAEIERRRRVIFSPSGGTQEQRLPSEPDTDAST